MVAVEPNGIFSRDSRSIRRGLIRGRHIGGPDTEELLKLSKSNEKRTIFRENLSLFDNFNENLAIFQNILKVFLNFSRKFRSMHFLGFCGRSPKPREIIKNLVKNQWKPAFFEKFINF